MSIISKQTNQYIVDPRQEAFKTAYFDPDSATFGNAYQSAVRSGYSEATAKDILHNRPKWLRLSEKGGENQAMEPESLLTKLTDIINEPTNGSVKTRDRLKAIELMMRHHGMLRDRVDLTYRRLTIDSVLE